MRCSNVKINKTITLLLFITLLAINRSEAKDSTTTIDSLLKLSISCPNNLQCNYFGKNLPINIVITNNSDQNLEIPLEAVNAYLLSSYLKKVHTDEGLGASSIPGIPRPDLLEQLTPLPAHKSVIIETGCSITELKKAFHKAHSRQIAFYAGIALFIHYQGSKQPIGNYKDGKFEPKRFILEAERVITKQ